MDADMKRILLPFALLVLAFPAGLAAWSLHNSDIEDVAICATNPESHLIPSSLCESYLFNLRGRSDDIQHLEQRAGLAFFFDLEPHEKRQRYLSFFADRGLSVDKASPIDGLPPLHAAILMNDEQLVAFLLAEGADRSQTDERQGLTPVEYLEWLQARNPGTDWSEVERRL